MQCQHLKDNHTSVDYFLQSYYTVIEKKINKQILRKCKFF